MSPACVIGTGQTKYVSNRPDVSTPELVFEAAHRALEDAQCELADVDAVVFASAPEVFEGVHEPDQWCAEACGAVGKPLFRVHTGGATGGSGALTATGLVSGGRFETVLAVGLERTGEVADAQQVFTTIFDPVYERDIQLNVITTVAMEASRQLELFGLTEDHMAWVATKNFTNALRNPYAHLHREIDAEDVKASRMLAWPLRLLHACPRSDGAAALVIGSEDRGRRTKHQAWIHGAGAAADVYRIGDRMDDKDGDFAGQRALRWAARRAYTQAEVRDPREDLDVVEVYAPFSNIEVASYEALGFADEGQGKRYVEEQEAGTAPASFCPSGGCQTANPIGATGMVRFIEAALQVSGQAGEHQVEGASKALATATGGINQFFTAAVLGSSIDPKETRL